MSRKKPTLADLLAQCDPSAPYAGEVWPEAQPVGWEYGASLKIDEAVVERHMIQEGLDDVTAGRLISMAAMERWADSLGVDHELPLPKVGE